jgi:periplasmic protein TonB
MLLHLDGLVRTAPHLPERRRTGAILPLAGSGIFHLLAVGFLAGVLIHSRPLLREAAEKQSAPAAITTSHFVFVARDPRPPGGGGGGGGNRQPGPIRRAEGVGRDAITLRVKRPAEVAEQSAGREVLPAVLLDARPLASGTRDLIGLPEGGVPVGTSLGPGSGGGVGDGAGTGIGPGVGPGVGPGSGGGIGGNVYRPGGSVTAPRAIREVKPRYTTDAMLRKLEGTVVLEFVVKTDGRPADIHVVRSLDSGGLDEQAILAAQEWRFEPGRLGGTPVDVLVRLLLDFHLH